MADASFDFETLPGARRVAVGRDERARRFIVLAPRRAVRVVALLVTDERRGDAEPRVVGVATEAQLRDLADALRSSPAPPGTIAPIGVARAPQEYVALVVSDMGRVLLSLKEDGSDARKIADELTEQQVRELGDACAGAADWLHLQGA